MDLDYVTQETEREKKEKDDLGNREDSIWNEHAKSRDKNVIVERKQRRKKTSPKKDEEQKRDRDEGGEGNKQTRRDVKRLWK